MRFAIALSSNDRRCIRHAIMFLIAALSLAAPAQAHPHKVVHHATIHESRHERWLDKYRSFEYPSGKFFAVPYPIATCESGENYYVGPYGAYGLILEEPWMSPKRQDEVAYDLYRKDGEEPWAPFETGCIYR